MPGPGCQRAGHPDHQPGDSCDMPRPCRPSSAPRRRSRSIRLPSALRPPPSALYPPPWPREVRPVEAAGEGCTVRVWAAYERRSSARTELHFLRISRAAPLANIAKVLEGGLFSRGVVWFMREICSAISHSGRSSPGMKKRFSASAHGYRTLIGQKSETIRVYCYYCCALRNDPSPAILGRSSGRCKLGPSR